MQPFKNDNRRLAVKKSALTFYLLGISVNQLNNSPNSARRLAKIQQNQNYAKREETAMTYDSMTKQTRFRMHTNLNIMLS